MSDQITEAAAADRQTGEQIREQGGAPEYRIRQAVRVEFDDSLDAGTATVTVDDEGPGVVVRISRDPWVDMLMAFSPQVQGDVFAMLSGDPLPEGRPIDAELAQLIESAREGTR